MGQNATFQKLLEAMEKSKIPEYCYKKAFLEYFRDHNIHDS